MLTSFLTRQDEARVDNMIEMSCTSTTTSQKKSIGNYSHVASERSWRRKAAHFEEYEIEASAGREEARGVKNKSIGSPTSSTGHRRKERNSAIIASIQAVAREQERYEGFIERLRALEKSSDELLVKDVSHSENRSTEAVLTEAENTFKIHYTTLQEAAKDNERIERNLQELDSLQEKVAEIIEVQGWEGASEIPTSCCKENCFREISALDFSDEISDITEASRCHGISISGAHNLKMPRTSLTHKSSRNKNDETVNTIACTADTYIDSSSSHLSEPTGTFVQHGDTAHCSQDPLSPYYDEEEINRSGWLDHDSSDFTVSELLEDARFIRSNERHLIISPSPFISPLMIGDKEDSEDMMCFPIKKTRNKDEECTFCVVQ